MAEIYNLDGEPMPILENPGEPVPSVVEAIEKLLEKARAGEAVGLVAVYCYSDGATGGYVTGRMTYSLIGRMEDLKLDILDELA